MNENIDDDLADRPQDPKDEDHLERSRMSFGGHLEELRKRLAKAIGITLLGTVVMFIYHREILELVVWPYRQVMLDLNRRPVLQTLGVPHAFFGYLKVSLIFGLLLTAPVWIYQMWAFISAGLYRKERGLIYRYAPFCVLLMMSGVLFGYFVLIPIGLKYLLSFGDPTVVQSGVTLSEYIGFFTILTLVLGVAFQLPLVMIGLARAGIVSPDGYRDKRKWTVLGIFIGASILTPPDVVTQVLLASPLVLLYELGILISWLSLGPDRPPIDRALMKTRARKLGILLLVLVLVWKPLTAARQSWRVDGWVCRDDTEGEMPLRRAIAKILVEEIPFAIKVRERDGVQVVVARSTGGGVRVFRIPPPEWQDLQVIDRREGPDGESFSVRFSPGGDPIATMERLREMAMGDMVPGLLVAYEYLSADAEKTHVRAILATISGTEPSGDDEAALAAYRSWFDGQHDAKWRDPR